MQYVTLAIPVKPHVRQYLLLNVLIKKPLRLCESNPIGSFLINAVEPKRKLGRPYKPNGRTVLQIELGTNKQDNHKMWIPKRKIRMFNRFVDSLIRNEFLNLVHDLSDDSKIDQIIRKFEQKYQLMDTNLSFATLKRWYYRKNENPEDE